MTDDSENRRHRHAVINGIIQHTSVSQIQTFERCNRMWRLDKVEHLPRKPPSKGQTRGSEGHKRLETLLRGGPNVLDPLEALAYPFLPKPGPGIFVEQPLENPTLLAGRLPMEGYIDLLDVRDPNVVKIYDHKFKSDVETYGTREKELTDLKKDAGIQMVAYAAWARKAYPSHKLAVLQHNQFQTKGSRCFVPVSAELPLDTALRKWEQWSGEVAAKMEVAAAAKSWTEVAGNVSACRSYGGCSFLKTCFPDPMERLADSIRAAHTPLEGHMHGGNMGFLKLGGLPAATSSATPAPAPQPAAPSAPSSAGVQHTKKDTLSIAAGPPTVTAGAGLSLPNIDPPLGIVPPDSPRNLPVQKPASKIIIEGATGPIPSYVPPFSPPAAAPVADTATPVTVSAATAAPGGEIVQPKKRGRPTGSKNAPAAALEPTPVVALPAALPDPVPPPAPPVTAQAPAAANPAPAVQEAGGGATTRQTTGDAAPATRGGARTPGVHRVCINCTPTKGETLDLLPYVLLLEKRILEGLQINMPIPDLRLCNDQVLGFGRWKSVLEAAVELKDLAAGTYVVTTRDERVLIVADVLSRILPDGSVVRGCL